MKQNFDDILKRKWEEKQFPVDEQHRAEMIALLDRKKRRGILPFWWLGGVMAVTVAAAIFFLNNREDVSTDSPIKELRISNEKPSQLNELASDATLPNNVVQLSNTADSQSSAEIKSSSFITFSTKSPSSETSTAGANTSSTTTTKPLSSNKFQTPTSTKSLPNNSTVAINSNDQAAKTPNASSNQPDTAANNYFLVEDEAMRSVIIATEPIGVTIVEDQPGSENDIVSTSLTPRGTIESSAFLDPLLMEGIQFTSEDAPGVIMAQTSFKKSLYLFGETGVGMIFASKPDYTSGWKFRAGAGLGFKLSPKVQLSWALGYLMQDGGFDFERTSTVNQPGFGVRSSFNTLTPERLHFVYTRFGMQYRMHRHLLGIHAGIQYLYGAQGTILIQKQDQFLPDVTETSANTWVNTNGLRKLNWTTDVSYGYQLTPRLSAVAGTDIYFSSITIPDAELAQKGYIWNGSIAALHPFITLNYLIYGR